MALLRYAPPRTQVDVKTNYSLSRQTSLLLDVENLFNEPLSTQTNYLAREDRKGQTRISSPKLVFGVQGRF